MALTLGNYWVSSPECYRLIREQEACLVHCGSCPTSSGSTLTNTDSYKHIKKETMRTNGCTGPIGFNFDTTNPKLLVSPNLLKRHYNFIVTEHKPNTYNQIGSVYLNSLNVKIGSSSGTSIASFTNLSSSQDFDYYPTNMTWPTIVSNGVTIPTELYFCFRLRIQGHPWVVNSTSQSSLTHYFRASFVDYKDSGYYPGATPSSTYSISVPANQTSYFDFNIPVSYKYYMPTIYVQCSVQNNYWS